MGGRFVLVKVFLESIPVFSLGIVNIPSSVLARIRQLILNFLWLGCGNSVRVHLCKWEDLAKPKAYDSWAIKNLY